MPLTPDYGATLLLHEELEALLPQTRELLGEPITKAAVFDLEQGVAEQESHGLLAEVVSGSLALDDLLRDSFLRNLHARLYGDIWSWAGRFRTREVNIGVAPMEISVALRNALDGIQYRWQHTSDWTAHGLGIAVHAETVRIHPFIDGNGRTTRLLADLVFVAAQDVEPPEVYDWNVEKSRYIDLLREYDRTRDARPLAEFVKTRPVR